MLQNLINKILYKYIKIYVEMILPWLEGVRQKILVFYIFYKGKLVNCVGKVSEALLVQNWTDLLKDNFDSVKVKAIESGALIIDKIN